MLLDYWRAITSIFICLCALIVVFIYRGLLCVHLLFGIFSFLILDIVLLILLICKLLLEVLLERVDRACVLVQIVWSVINCNTIIGRCSLLNIVAFIVYRSNCRQRMELV